MTVKSNSNINKSKPSNLTQSSEAAATAISTKSDKNNTREEAKDEESGESAEENDSSEDTPAIKLYKSTRLKGYITLLLASAINYSSATQSDSAILNSAVPATQGQKNYASAVSMTTLVITIVIVLLHLDPSPLQKLWITAFKPKSKIELGFILFFVIWWVTATWIETSVGGIAGTGKGQYNLYFSTWACCWTSIWTLERWIVASGMASFKAFLAEWPNRAPSWIATLILSFCTLLTYVDLFVHWSEKGSAVLQDQLSQVGRAQWQWLLFVASITIPCALGFVVVEVFREQGPQGDQNEKSQWEIILEGVILLLLVIGWIPSVMVATTPGGIASLVGNAYFFTWATTVFVMETFVWWIHDWRRRIHLILQQQQTEYEKIQEKVQKKSEAALHDEKVEELTSVTQVEQLSDSGKEESTTSNEVENTEDADDDHEEITTYSEQIPDSIGA
jgi:nucleotide-binding universal stress UspA family protein